MSLAEQFAGAVERAQFYDLSKLADTVWKAHAAGHLADSEAQALAEQIEIKKPGAEPTSFKAVKPPPPQQRSPDKQASIERRRRLARASPVPPELFGTATPRAARSLARHGTPKPLARDTP
jgi:hypothetical protein